MLLKCINKLFLSLLSSLIFFVHDTNAQTCPVGSASAVTGYAVIAQGGNSNTANSIGAIVASGATLSTGNSTTLSSGTLTLDFKAWIAQGSTVTISWARSGGTPTATVAYSNDSVTFTTLGAGTLSGSGNTNAVYTNFTVPAGGLRYIRITRTGGTLFIDGVRRTHTCYSQVDAVNDTRVFLSPGTGKGNVFTNDYNHDYDTKTFSVAGITTSNGTLTFNSNGYYTYTPNTNFDGVDKFSYRVCDAGPDGNIATTGDNGCDTAVVTLRSLFNCDSTKFYVPIPENEAMDFLKDINSGNGDSTRVYLGISVSTDAIVVYDHWEDGYETNIKAPTQSTTKIWGDGDLSNGVAPGFPTDILDAGRAIILTNNVNSGHSGATTYNPNAATSDNTLQAVTDYDGKDKVFIGGNGAMTKLAWGSVSTLSVNGAAVPAASNWGTSYVLPVGLNTANRGNSIDIANLSVMAKESNTIVQFDYDRNGAIDFIDTLNEGETFYKDSRQGTNTITVNEGATISSNKPIMVYLLTANYNSNYQGRTYPLIPNSQLSTCYYMPAVPNLNVRVFLYNRTGSSITVTRTTASGPATTISVGANSSNFDDVNSSGLGYRYCSSVPFSMVAFCDFNSTSSDWGFIPVPTANLTNKVLMSFGAGCDPTNASLGTVNYTVAHVMVDSNTFVYVDVNGDGTPDNVSFNQDVDATDNTVTIGGVNYNETTSANGIALAPYQTLTIGSTTGSLNGALIYTKTAANNGGDNGKNVIVVWGQNGGPAGSPNIDAGYTVPNIDPFIGGTSIIKTADSVCLGSNLDSITVKYSGVSPYRIFWFNETTGSFSTSTVSADSFVINNLEAGTYLVKVKDANCNIFQQRTTIGSRTTGCSFTVTGRLFNDSNGLVNSAVDGRGFGNPNGQSMYVYLVNSLGVVIDSSVVNPLTGTYSLTGVRFSNYTLRLSTVAAGINATAPASSLPSGWANVGEQYGTGNNAGTGVESGTPNGDIQVRILASNITNVNLGIERPPSSTSQSFTITTPSFSLQDTMRLNRNGASPNGLVGSDPEDGNLSTNGKVRIYAPANNQLYYDANNDGVLAPGELITDSLTVNNYNKDLLIAKYTTVGSTSMSFGYSFMDRANRLSPRSTYTVSWAIPLPIDKVDLSVKCNDGLNIVKWYIDIDDRKEFVLESNSNATQWNELRRFMNASNTEYYFIDSSHQKDVFYRLRSVDNSIYTNVIKGDCNASNSLSVYPIPSENMVYISGVSEYQSLSVVNESGSAVQPKVSTQGQIIELGFDKLPAGIYLVKISVTEEDIRFIKVVIVK